MHGTAEKWRLTTVIKQLSCASAGASALTFQCFRCLEGQKPAFIDDPVIKNFW